MSLASEQSKRPLVTSVFLDDSSSYSALSQALLELSQTVWDSLDAATAAIAYAVVKNLGATSCQVWLYTDSHSRFQPVAHYGTIGSDISQQAIAVTDYGNYFDRLLQRDWLIINTSELAKPTSRAKDDSHASIPPYLWHDRQTVTALIEMPIRYEGQIVGVLCCTQRHMPRVWQAAEKSFMVTASCLIALAISHASQQQNTKLLNKQDRQLKLAIIERQQAEQAWQESQRFIRGILDASSNILYVNNFANGTNYYVNGYMENILGYSPDEIQQLGPQFLERLAHPNDIQILHQAHQQLAQSQSGDVIEHEYRLQHKQGRWHWLLCRETIFQWSPEGTPLQVLGTATDITVHKENTVALEQQNQELTALARVDALTQIANRRVFDEFLRTAWMSRNQAPLTLILCDIDHFKLYNDTYGHQAGDDCLRLVAQALQKAVKRQPDLVARYGGEEFAVVLPNTALTGAKHVAQVIQTSVQELKIEHRLSTVSPYLTVSLGIATVTSTTGGSPQELIIAADRGLYQAKSEGRAQCSVGQLG